MFRVNPGVVNLFLSLLQPPKNTQLYSNAIDPWARGGAAFLDDRDVMLTGIAKSKAMQLEFEELFRNRMKVIRTDNPEYYDPPDQFHLGFAVHPFGERQEHIPVQDKLGIWKCSEHDPNRIAPAHVIGMEGLLRAVLCGGYFGVVVPKSWIGKRMSYMRWWQNHAALVANIKLPAGAVAWDYGAQWREEVPGVDPVRMALPRSVHPETERVDREFLALPPEDQRKIIGEDYSPEWRLCIFQKPTIYSDLTPRSAKIGNLMPFAEYRYSPFIFTLESFSSESIKSAMVKFFRHDWWKNNVNLWNQMLGEQDWHPDIGTTRTTAIGIPEKTNQFIFDAKPEYQQQLVVVDKAADIKDNLGVQIKFGSRVRLTPRSGYAIGAVLDIKARGGMEANEEGQQEFTLDRELARRPFPELRDEVIAKICDAGLTPYMTANDFHRMKKRERWLSIQLTPTERDVHVGAHTEEEQIKDPGNWETMYDDVGMRSTFPELIEMWMKRAKQMKIDRFVNEFQLRDIVYQAIYQSHLNGNVPGLGKTRETLFTAILRGVTKMLIIVPSKLIGTWQDEIRDVIVPYARLQKRNWQGKIIDPTVNVIEYGADLAESNLAMFNLIGMDKLKQTPRDGLFYKCPECGTIVFSKYKDSVITCPGDANSPGRPMEEFKKQCSQRLVNWREENRYIPGERQGRRKYRVFFDENGNEILRINGTKYPWQKAWAKKFGEAPPDNFPVERMKVVDERRPRPDIPICEATPVMHSKMIRYRSGTEIDKITNEEKPIFKYKKRDFHVKWTFAELVRWRFNFVAADELHHYANESSKRNQALEHVTGSTRIGLTGTPMKGYPEKILPLINWVFPREVFPDYREYDPEGTARWNKKYQLVVNIDATELADGTMSGGERKRLPKINNPELFQAEMSSLILRRVRHEPEVVRSVPPYEIQRNYIEVPMDEQHKLYYQKWLNAFSEWWAEMKRERDGVNVEAGSILTKLTYLSNASFIPHYMLDPIYKGADIEGKKWAKIIGPYKGPVVGKMRKAWELVREAIGRNEKTLVFSYRTKNSDLGHLWCKKQGFASMTVDGRDSLTVKSGNDRTERHLKVQQFRERDYQVMWAGTNALAEGMNIPEANNGIVMDYYWEDIAIRQAIGRMLRIQQQKKVTANYLLHLGAIDSYMAALSLLKARSTDEAIDYMQFDDFHVGMVPDIRAYADAIVDGTTNVLTRKMWTAIDFMTKKKDEEGDYDNAD